MKLKELFDKYTFDEILPYLKEIEPDRGDSMYQFREAFDILRYMEPSEEECGVVHIEWSDDEEDTEKYITVNHLAGDLWERNLAKEVVLAENLQINEMQMVAYCLWEITYYGFNREEDEEDRSRFSIHREKRNKYDIALYKIQLSNWKHTTPRRYRSMAHPLCTDIEFCLKRTRSGQNRSKRKRDYRVECRENYLKRHSQREDFITKLTRCGAFKREDVEYLHQVEEGYYYPYVSRTWDVSKRVDYILESINKYQEVKFSSYNDAIICLRSSSEHPVTEAEKNRLLEGLPKALKAFTITIGLGTKETMKQEIEMLLYLNVIK